MLQTFDLWSTELSFTESLLRRDPSMFHYCWIAPSPFLNCTALQRTIPRGTNAFKCTRSLSGGPLNRSKEKQSTLELTSTVYMFLMIRRRLALAVLAQDPDNESPWSYLLGYVSNVDVIIVRSGNSPS